MNSSTWIPIAIALLAGYLAGSIPFGLIISRGLKGIDPRESGSRNIGFTNVLRVAGRGPGLLTLIGDLGKGFLVIRLVDGLSIGEPWNWLTGLSAVLGHNYTVFLGFKGGKGVATGLGVLYGIDPRLGWSMAGIWVVMVGLWRYSSLGAIAAFGLLPVLVLYFHPAWPAVASALLLSLLILLRHKGNIQRLWAGTEPKIGRSSSS